jgi:hypothetical protein
MAMKAAREDRLVSDGGQRGFPLKHVILVLAIVAMGYVFWQTLKEQEKQPEPVPVVAEPVVAEPPPLPPAEDIPRRPEPVVARPAEAAPAEPEPPALPPLEESDPIVREQLAAAGLGPELDRLREQQNLIQQGTALIDGFSRGLVLRKLLPIDPPKLPFPVAEEGNQPFMDPAGYSRYNDYAEAIATLDTAALVDDFHTMRPLYEQAYGLLGLNPEDFDNAVIRMLDRILATPEIDTPIALTRKSVMYQYADPQLEALSPMQKQLLRMGPENIRRIKEQAKALRAGLLSQP